MFSDMELHLSVLFLMIIQYDFENVIMRIRGDTNHLIEYLYAINHIWLFQKLNLSINVNFLGLSFTNLFDIQYVPNPFDVFLSPSLKTVILEFGAVITWESIDNVRWSFEKASGHFFLVAHARNFDHFDFISSKIWRLMLFFGVMLFWFWFICLPDQIFIIRRNQSNQIQDRLL